MGRVGFRSGGIHAQNFQGGTVDVTVDSSGDGTTAVVFDHAMKAVPAIVLTSREADYNRDTKYLVTYNVWIQLQE